MNKREAGKVALAYLEQKCSEGHHIIIFQMQTEKRCACQRFGSKS